MTNAEILKRYDELSKTSGITGMLGWYIYKNLKILDTAIEPYRLAHNDLIRKYGGSEIQEVPMENRAAFSTETLELLGLETDVTLEKMKRKQFEHLIKSASGISAESMLILDRNIVEEA